MPEKAEDRIFLNTKIIVSVHLYIKNMVCARCIRVVREELEKLGLKVTDVRLGEAVTEGEADTVAIRRALADTGFELIDNRQAQIVEKIKNIIVEKIHHSDYPERSGNFSEILAIETGLDYHYISALFSSMENITVEKFVILQKIEKVKELLRYDQLSLSEISYKLGYSSVAHLSRQFRQVTGMTASEYKKLRDNIRIPIDRLAS